MVKYYSDSERKENSCHYYIAYSFRLAAKDLLYALSTDRIAHNTAYVKPVMEI